MILMKFIFICGSLEPGRDGVGDYVRRFAGELISRGHSAVGLALNDRFIQEFSIDVQITRQADLPVLRLPSLDYSKAHIELVKGWIDKFNPDLLSLQFVPFAFNPKGLPFGLVKYLNLLGENRNWHIMFHELWVGRPRKFSFKRAIMSFLQQHHIKTLIKILKPANVHTHLPVFQSMLKSLGVSAKGLPLFSNIEMQSLGGQAVQSESIFRLIFFSQIDSNDILYRAIKSICKAANIKGFKPELLIVSGNSKKVSFAKSYYSQVPFLNKITATGFLSDKEISDYLSTGSVGVTPIPRHALGKSGSVAALISAGLPVLAPIVMENFLTEDMGFFDEELRKVILTNVVEINTWKIARDHAPKASNSIALEIIADKFLADLIIT